MSDKIAGATNAKPKNLTNILRAEIERVSLKQERLKGYMAADPGMAASFGLSYRIMTADLASAREALKSATAALATLRGYSDDD